MASLRKNHKGKFYIIRGRLADGSSFEYAIDVPQEPPGLSLGDPGYAEAKAELARLAQEEADDVETRSRGKMDEKEYEARAKFRAKKVLRENARTSPPAFILGWLWEHVIRNRIDYTKTLFLCNLMNRLLAALSKPQWLRLAHKLKNPLPPVNERRLINLACEIADIQHWPSDVLRKTCATHLRNHYQDDWHVVRDLGNSVRMLLKHYVDLHVPEKQSRAFWQITPAAARRELKRMIAAGMIQQ